MFKLFLLSIIQPFVLMTGLQESAVYAGPSFQPKFILPLVLIRTQDEKQYTHPTDISVAVTEKANFLRGTIFSANKEGKQLFFCGHNDDDADLDNRYCSYELPESEQGSEILTCAYEPVPLVQKITQMNSFKIENDIPCETIHNKQGKMFGFGYEVKTNDNEETDFFEVYRFCYNEKTKQILFTEHSIAAPRLLNSQLLELERGEMYEMSDDEYGFFGTKYRKIKNLYKKLEKENAQKKRRRGLFEKTPIMSSFLISDQKLVPSDDMAFATWRKTTFHFLNVREMENKKIQLWDHISQLIREDAIKKSREYHILTGAFDLSDYGKDENEPIRLPDLWIKLVHYKWVSLEEHNESIAIIMNHYPESDFVNRSVENYCKENLCKNVFVEKFPDIGGYVCCTGSLEKIEFFFNTGLKFNDHTTLKIDSFYKK